MHHPTLDREGRTITSAITTLDMHDFARLARTYGLAGVLVQTNLPQQVELIKRLLGHWVEGKGGEFNADRKHALECITFVPTFEDAVAGVEEQCGERPLVVATSARDVGKPVISFDGAEEELSKSGRPLIILFGTASGLAPEVFEGCDLVLEPIGSPSGYNHLSVRSAASITVDRIFGQKRQTAHGL
jgi:hypothetical protein